MIDKYKNVGKIKLYLIFSLTDETYSLVCGTDCGKEYYCLVSVIDHVYWVAGTALGALIGSSVKFNTEGIDFTKEEDDGAKEIAQDFLSQLSRYRDLVDN